MVTLAGAAASLMTDRCDIYTVNAVPSENHATAKVFQPTQTNVPCRLWFSYLTRSKSDNAASATVQSVRLFLPPDTKIPNGSRVIVTRRGQQYICINAGTPAYFSSHTMVMLERSGGWS